ncbi:hypothetical protein GCM10020218_003470 [Dactylosporangium vinaceum]
MAITMLQRAVDAGVPFGWVAADEVYPGDPDRPHYWEAFRWENEHAERGRPLADPPQDPLVVVVPDRIVYTEHWLRRDGYNPRQFWHRT